MPQLLALLRRIDERLEHALLAAARITVGLLWLANLEWKRPPDFGSVQRNGLYKYVLGAVEHPVFAPYSWFVEHVVLKHYTLFGWVTLVSEGLCAALLILGLWTRAAALLGAVLSVAIALSVLHYPNEWPWAYYLMVAAHVLVFASGAGRHASLDAARRRPHGHSVAAAVLALTAIVVGVWGAYTARGIAFTARHGALLGWAGGEVKLLWFNRLGGLLTALLGVVALASRLVPSAAPARLLRLVAVGGFALMAVQVLLQWRYANGRWTSGLLGGAGPNAAFWGMMAAGLALAPHPHRGRAANPAGPGDGAGDREPLVPVSPLLSGAAAADAG